MLFTWNGTRFVCLGDFLGGGLGYLIAPGVYGQPDRDEAVAVAPEQLRAEQGVYRLSITEPMDEAAYLDHLRLDVVDRPPGVSTTADERFAPSGPRPTGQVLAWRNVIDPASATDLEGRDMTATLKHWDRRAVDTFGKLEGWIGYAAEQGIILVERLPACSRPTTTGSESSARATRPGSSSKPPACRGCRPAGLGPTSCGPSAIARTPTRSRRPATRSSRCHGGACPPSRSLPVSPANQGGARRLSPRVPDAPGG